MNRIIVLLLLAGCAAQPAAPPVPSDVRVPIDRFARIAEGLYRSAQPNSASLRALKEADFRTIINFRSQHSERAEAEALGLRVVEIPMTADKPPTDDEVRRYFEVVLDRAARPVLIHCAVGRDRTGAMAALYRIEVEGWTNNDAVAEMLALGFNKKYVDLMEFVRAYRPRGFARK